MWRKKKFIVAVVLAGVLLAGSWAERRAKAGNDDKFAAG